MRVLVLGGSGATGKEVVRQLVKREVLVRILVRQSSILADDILHNPQVDIVRGELSTYTHKEMQGILNDCDAVVSCLGHNISFKGMYGNPRRLVYDAVRTICEAVNRSSDKKIKFILMSTSGYTNDLIGEKRSVGENIVNTLLYTLLPPHSDNVKAGNFLTKTVGSQNPQLEWVAVRPDSLIDSNRESPYYLEPSPVRSPIFNAGQTSRINVAHFMAELLTNENLWQQWKYQTPVIYNRN